MADFRPTRALTKSTTPDKEFKFLMVTTSGSIEYVSRGGDVTVLPVVPVNIWFPVGNATHVLPASTADGILVF